MKHWKLFGMFLAAALYGASAHAQQQESQSAQQAQPAAQTQTKIPAGAKVFVAAMGGFETPLKKAMAGKKVPLQIVEQREEAEVGLGERHVVRIAVVGQRPVPQAVPVGELVQEVVTAPHPSPILPFATYVFQSYAAYYPEIALERILIPAALRHLRDTWEGCIDDALASGYWAESIPSHQFVTQPDLGPLLKAAAANEPGRLRIAAPTLLIQGTSDRTIPPKATDAVARDLCRMGNSVSYRTYSDVSHEGVLAAAKADIEAWVDARFAGAKATSNCDQLPSAEASR